MDDAIEEAVVVIVGAGPSGLALGVNLARMNVKVEPLILHFSDFS